MKEIAVKNRKGEIKCYFTVDDEDYEEVMKHKWHEGNGYIKNSKIGRLTRWLLNVTDKNIVVDHIDHNPLNNCRSNLREASPSLNAHNATRSEKHLNKYVGVSFDKQRGKWRVRLSRKSYGMYENEKVAAQVYNWFAIKKYGTDANLNDVPMDENFVPPIIRRLQPKEDRGVYFGDGKWKIELNINGIRTYFGSHKTKEDALKLLKEIKKKEESQINQKLFSKTITRNKDGIAIIPIKSKNEINYCLVDDDLWYNLNQCAWFLLNGYVRNGSRYLHSQIIPKKEGYVIDHINNNRLDNRKLNLRYATYSQNSQNRIKYENGKFRGVRKQFKKYQARIKHLNIEYHLGTFDTPEEAAKAYDKKALELYGPHAKINF